jgi:large subunit ribosomal protein L13
MSKEMEYTIDATGQSLGRVASEAAKVLMGKDEPDFERHIQASKTVSVVNASKLIISEKKKDQKEYITFSG